MAENTKSPRPTASQFIEVQSKLCEALERIQRQEDDLNAFRRSNELLEEELVRVRSANEALHKSNNELQVELQVMKQRGFFARLFNRQKKEE